MAIRMSAALKNTMLFGLFGANCAMGMLNWNIKLWGTVNFLYLRILIKVQIAKKNTHQLWHPTNQKRKAECHHQPSKCNFARSVSAYTLYSHRRLLPLQSSTNSVSCHSFMSSRRVTQIPGNRKVGTRNSEAQQQS